MKRSGQIHPPIIPDLPPSKSTPGMVMYNYIMYIYVTKPDQNGLRSGA